MIAATPPADHLLDLGLTDTAKTYPLLVDRRYASPAEDALKDVEAGVIDAAILWGPIGGYFASKASPPLSATPLKEDTRPLFSFRIAFGVRRNESDWKHRLNAAISNRQKDMDAVLESYRRPPPADRFSARRGAPPCRSRARRRQLIYWKQRTSASAWARRKSATMSSNLATLRKALAVKPTPCRIDSTVSALTYRS